MKNPAAHEAHDLPLANRIVSDLIGEFIDTGCAIASAGTGNLNDYERGAQAAIDQMRHLHMSGVDYRLTPKILDALRRAGLLVESEHALG